MSVKITYLVHGATADNENHIASGWNDKGLSELGRKQALDQGSLLTEKKFDVIMCSDLKRAVESIEIGFGDKFKIIKDKRLRECNYGDLNGAPDTSFKNDILKYVNSRFPNGESYEDVKIRIQDLLNFIKSNYEGKHIALLAHQAPQLALEVLLNGKSWQQAIEGDWRKTMSWQPGWEYILK